MEGFLVLLGFGLFAAIVGVPIAAFVALSRTGKLQLAIAELDRQVQRLRGDAQELQRMTVLLADGFEHTIAYDRMGFHQRALFLRQSARLQEDLLGQANLAYVV